MWRHERPEVKARFKALADEEDRRHKLMYPGYRYVAGRRNPQLPPFKRNLPCDPMRVAERLIAAGLESRNASHSGRLRLLSKLDYIEFGLFIALESSNEPKQEEPE